MFQSQNCVDYIRMCFENRLSYRNGERISLTARYGGIEAHECIEVRVAAIVRIRMTNFSEYSFAVCSVKAIEHHREREFREELPAKHGQRQNCLRIPLSSVLGMGNVSGCRSASAPNSKEQIHVCRQAAVSQLFSCCAAVAFLGLGSIGCAAPVCEADC